MAFSPPGPAAPPVGVAGLPRAGPEPGGGGGCFCPDGGRGAVNRQTGGQNPGHHWDANGWEKHLGTDGPDWGCKGPVLS